MVQLVLAVDFEGAGGVISKHGITRVGASLHDLDTGKKLAGFNSYVNRKGYEWEERCVEEFWKKNPKLYKETLEETEKATMSPYEVIAEFIEWAQQKVGDNDCYLISDNVAYDIALLRYFSTIDIMYIFGKYQSVRDISSAYVGMAMLQEKVKCTSQTSGKRMKALTYLTDKKDFPDFGVTHDHNPENDAATMAYQWCYIQNELA